MQLLIIIRVAQNRAFKYATASTTRPSVSLAFKSTLGTKDAMLELERMDALASSSDVGRGSSHRDQGLA